MKKFLLTCAAPLVIASLAYAQNTPQYEVFVGGSYLHLHGGGDELAQMLSLSPVQYQPHNINLNLYGWEASIAENLNRWFGGEFDASGYYGSPSAGFLYPATELVSPSPNFGQTVPVITREQTYMFGPRLTWRKHNRLVLFAHLPIGVANVNTSLNESSVVASNFQVLPTGKISSSSGLALSPGVGIDVPLNSRVTVRAFQLDYLLTHAFGQRQDNARLSAGVNFTFGEK